MLSLRFGPNRNRLRVLCLGAHSDDIEIGCAGTLLRWLQEFRQLEVTWTVMNAAGPRAAEAKKSAFALLRRAARLDLALGSFEDSYLPAHFSQAKKFLQNLRGRTSPDVVLTHRLEDKHQDHRLVAELTWQTWRDHLVFEYEIPKYEGDLGQPNVFVPLSRAIAKRKVGHLQRYFGTQRSKDWFSADTFFGLMRVRGVECRASSGFAEGFQVRKAVL